MKKAGEAAKVTVLRAGEQLHFDIKLGPVRQIIIFLRFPLQICYFELSCQVKLAVTDYF